MITRVHDILMTCQINVNVRYLRSIDVPAVVAFVSTIT